MKQPDPKKTGRPHLIFETKMHDFGTVKNGDKVTHIFRYTNEGDTTADIEIITACDCTILEYDRTKPIKPGESASIKAIFDTTTETGDVDKEITIILKNTDPPTGYPIVYEVRYKAKIID